jgi:hypothetical protein
VLELDVARTAIAVEQNIVGMHTLAAGNTLLCYDAHVVVTELKLEMRIEAYVYTLGDIPYS